VEVSKASTGNIQVNAEEFDVCVLLQQAVGEYHEKLKKAHLEAVTHIGALPLPIVADGNLLWRVFDNLLGNICKYSMPGTRVYLDAFVQDGRCCITFKNISKAPLEKTSEELLERFVRDDLSRNTEGSGLGLPIAKSLLELQGGTLDVSTDGDLFKATVSFPFNQ
jgi:signal transduction histidine kinase